ncbi:hypothetical protein K3495_g305 [Podosphaera aphanis]|nr:hypothetical protein K3495_g305 [Podosphaera aphanis]
MDFDDKYRMVEDELLSIAQQFTYSLHKIEYKKQKKISKNRSEESKRNISRPVTEKKTTNIKKTNIGRKPKSKARMKSQNDFGDDCDASDNSQNSDILHESHLPYIGTSLHDLMENPQKGSKALALPGTLATGTRAAAGFSKAHEPNVKQGTSSNLTKKGEILQYLPKSKTFSEASNFSLDEDYDGLDALDIGREASSSLYRNKKVLKCSQMTRTFSDASTLSSDDDNNGFDAPVPEQKNLQSKPPHDKKSLEYSPKTNVLSDASTLSSDDYDGLNAPVLPKPQQLKRLLEYSSKTNNFSDASTLSLSLDEDDDDLDAPFPVPKLNITETSLKTKMASQAFSLSPPESKGPSNLSNLSDADFIFSKRDQGPPSSRLNRRQRNKPNLKGIPFFLN